MLELFTPNLVADTNFYHWLQSLMGSLLCRGLIPRKVVIISAMYQRIRGKCTSWAGPRHGPYVRINYPDSFHHN